MERSSFHFCCTQRTIWRGRRLRGELATYSLSFTYLTMMNLPLHLTVWDTGDPTINTSVPAFRQLCLKKRSPDKRGTEVKSFKRVMNAPSRCFQTVIVEWRMSSLCPSLLAHIQLRSETRQHILLNISRSWTLFQGFLLSSSWFIPFSCQLL